MRTLGLLIATLAVLCWSHACVDEKACTQDEVCSKGQICVAKKCVIGCRRGEDCGPGEGCFEQKCSSQECRPGQVQACYTGPSATQGKGICLAGKRNCSEAGKWSDCSGQRLPQKEQCDKEDNDCNGKIDDGLDCRCDRGAKRACYTGAPDTARQSPCKPGTQLCDKDNKWSRCFEEITPTPEICDKEDNDCNGKTDDGLAACGCKEGEVRSCYPGPSGTQDNAPCKAGEQKCVSQQWGPCEGAVLPQAELCGNGKDDDCNGKVDDNCSSRPDAGEPSPELPPEPSSPSTTWVTALGSQKVPGVPGVENDLASAVATSSKGEIYVAGQIGGSIQSLQITNQMDTSLFLGKLDAKGAWVWGKTAKGEGSSAFSAGKAVAVDGNGDVYVAGYFRGKVTFGSVPLDSGGPDKVAVFVARLDEQGRWRWAIPGGVVQRSGALRPLGMVLGKGSLTLVGSFHNSSTFGSHSMLSQGAFDVFVAQLDLSVAPASWSWAVAAGSSGPDQGYGIATDGKDFCITGEFQQTAIFGASRLTSVGGSDGFVAGVSAAGKWLWVKGIGSKNADAVRGIAFHPKSRQMVVAGKFSGSIVLDQGLTGLTLNSQGSSDAFVVGLALKPSSVPSWAFTATAGGKNNDEATALAVDDRGNILVTGAFSLGPSGQENSSFGSSALRSVGLLDVFVAQMDSTGSWLWARSAGGTRHDTPHGIALFKNATYVVGQFDTQATFGALSPRAIGGRDLFVWALMP